MTPTNVWQVMEDLNRWGGRYAFHEAARRNGILSALWLIWVARSM
jgi:hypothetical protein